VQFANSKNPTWDNLATAQWSTIEINVGIICACMPSMRVLLLKIFPRLKGTTNQSSANGYYASNNNHANRSSSKRIGTSSQVGTDGINFSKSFTLKYGSQEDEDEVQLVPMNNINPLGSKSDTRAHESVV
jgi:hypothetical protein